LSLPFVAHRTRAIPGAGECRLDGYDHPTLQERVLHPFGPGGSLRYRTASHDLTGVGRQDPPLRNAQQGTVLVLDGLLLHRDELVGS